MSIYGVRNGRRLPRFNNYRKAYSDVEVKVRDATSTDPWGPSGTQMNELAQLTYNQQDFVEIMEMLDKRVNAKGKHWMHVFKSLTVLDYLLHAGSENVVLYSNANIYVIKILKEFQYIDEDGKDQGANQRRNRAHTRDRILGEDPVVTGDDDENGDVRRRSENSQAWAQKWRNQEPEDLEKALERSRRSSADETQRAAYVAQHQETAKLQALWNQDQQQQAQWSASQQQQQANLFAQPSLQAQPTGYGSNNPFALATGLAQISSPQPPMPSFGSQSLSPASGAAPQQPHKATSPQPPPSRTAPDTFGNVGMLWYDLATGKTLDLQEADHLFEGEKRRLKAIENSNSRALFDDDTPPAGLASQRNNPFTPVDTSLPNTQQTRLQRQDSTITNNPFFKEIQRARELTAE
ncbi:hypothetical protein FRC04_006027 [Tulasnella sp. 424]|nr:hypothetical protein FRC04_006027 [Tulasnella sp. 424]KAG8975617.1 hypothetical protein FRC05_005410 [Tulasnella sp. 425]